MTATPKARRKATPQTGGLVAARRAPPNKNVLTLSDVPGRSRERQRADLGLGGVVTNARTSATFGSHLMGELDLTECVAALTEKTQAVQAGDLSGAESMLMAQAVGLDLIFNELARRGARTMGEHLNVAETYLRLAFRAQSQCRATLETLAEIKNPASTSFVRQANVAIGGPQQVNNAIAARAGERDQANKLMGGTDAARMDAAPPSTPIAVDSPMEAVGILHGAADGRR